MAEPTWSTRLVRTRSFRDVIPHIVGVVPFAVVYTIVSGRPLAFAWRAALAYAAFVSVFSVARLRRPAGRNVRGKIELRPSSTATSVATVAMLALVGGFANALRRHPPTPSIWAVFGVVVGLVVVFIAGMARWQLRVDDRGVDSRSALGPFGRVTFVRWSSVTRLESYTRVQRGSRTR